MAQAIVVVNAGSSSIKFSVFRHGVTSGGAALALALKGQAEALYTAPHFVAKDATGVIISEKSWGEGIQLGHGGALDHLRAFLREGLSGDILAGVGHRVVHGGPRFSEPVRVDAVTLEEMERLAPLAPLHQVHNLAPIRVLMERAPGIPQVACFDTSFHRTNPEIAQRFALPEEFHRVGVRRYGFHGLSYEYIASALPRFDERAARGKTVVLHLGNGASMCALDGGRSIASTMGFTGVDGLVMGTRVGNLDPGVMLYLMDEQGMDARAIEELIYHQAGLLGVSGISSDMRTLLESDDPRAKLAVDLYCYRIRRELGSLVAALGGLDALVFTAGVGENATVIREQVMRDAAWLGVHADAAANAKGGPRVSSRSSRVAAWVIPTDEEGMIATHTCRLLAALLSPGWTH